MELTLSYSSELMSNYMQGVTVSPDKKFEALQSPDGHSLLFSIGSDGVFYLTEEMPTLSTGWQKSNLSASLSAFFPSGTTIIAKNFEVSQYVANNKFTVVLVATVSGVDYLYIASSYSRSNDNSVNLHWIAIPFDAPEKNYSPLTISGISIIQTVTLPLIVVDVAQNTTNTIDRYYIDSTKYVSKTYWNSYSLPVNFDSQSVSICGGRKYNDSVDGIYTLGNNSGVWSIFYQQIFNPFNPKQPGSSSLLSLGNGAIPTAIASTPSAVISSTVITYTDLYSTSQSGDLYLFTADNQVNNATALLIMTNDLFKNIVQLYAYTSDLKVVVWGLNRSQQVFYTQCNKTEVLNPSAWSYPLPIGSMVEQISPYINKVNGGNTFFAQVGADTFKKVFQDPVSTIWTSQNIVLPSDPTSKNATKFDCYMTRITVLDETNSPVSGESITIESSYRVPVFINNHYYVLDTAAISIPTDTAGGIKIVQPVVNLQGACLTIQSANGGEKLKINPMDKAANKVATLNTPDTLTAATVTEDNGTPQQPLVSPNTSQDDLQATADSINSLIDAYNNYNVSSSGASSKAVSSSFVYIPSPTVKIYTLSVSPQRKTLQLNVIDSVGDTLSKAGDWIETTAGDLCSWLKNEAEYVIQIIEDTAQKVWNFVATVAGKVYNFIIDCVEKAIAAIEAIFQALMTAIKDLVQFLKFLFSWDDITRTKDVMKNILLMYMNYGVGNLSNLKGSINDEILDLKNKIANWAGLPPAADNLTNSEQPVTYTQSQTDYSNVYTSPNTYLQDFFNNNIANASSDYGNLGSSIETLIVESIRTMVDALSSEKQAIQSAIDLFQTELLNDDKWKTMSTMDVIKTSIGIVSECILDTAGVAIDAIIDCIVTIFDVLIVYISEPIWIPIVSNILEEIFGFEIQFSLLDILCLVGAIPATLIYKILNQKAPFTADDGFSTQIMNATDYQSLQTALGVNNTPTDYSKEFYSSFWLPESAKNVIFETSHILSGFMAGVFGVLVIVEDIAQLPWVPYVSQARSYSSGIQSIGYTAAGVLAKPYPIQNSAVSKLSSAITYIGVASSILFGIAGKKSSNEASKSLIAEAGAVVDILISLTAIAPVAYHFVELAEVDSNNMRTLAIIDETARICGNLGSISADIAKFDAEPTTSIVIAGVSAGVSLVNGGLQIAESIVDDQD